MIDELLHITLLEASYLICQYLHVSTSAPFYNTLKIFAFFLNTLFRHINGLIGVDTHSTCGDLAFRAGVNMTKKSEPYESATCLLHILYSM